MANRKINTRIKDIMAERGMTLTQVAEKAGSSSAYISAIINTEKSQSLNGFLKVADALGVPFEELFMKPEPVYYRRAIAELKKNLFWAIRESDNKPSENVDKALISLRRSLSEDEWDKFVSAELSGTGLERYAIDKTEGELF